MSRRKIHDEADARACIAAAARSGLTRPAWARAHGVDGRSLNAWSQNLERRAAPPVRFVELVPAARITATPEPAPLRLRRGELELEVPPDFDDAHLLRVLRVMAAC